MEQQHTLVTLNRTIRVSDAEGNVYGVDAFIGRFVSWGHKDEVNYKPVKIFGRLPKDATSIQAEFSVVAIKTSTIVATQEVSQCQ